MTPSLVSVRPSSNPSKKFTAVFSDGSKVDFGAAGYMDYTMYVARNGAQEAGRKRAAYIEASCRGTVAESAVTGHPLENRAVAISDDRTSDRRVRQDPENVAQEAMAEVRMKLTISELQWNWLI